MPDVLKNLVVEYCSQYAALKDEFESLNNFDFNREHGLRIKVPSSWEPQNVLPVIVSKFKDTLIVYNTAEDYATFVEMLNATKPGWSGNVTYMSWLEIYYAIFNKSRDTRALQKVNKALSAEAVVVMSSFNVDQEVLFHIQTFASGCLICLE